MKGHINNNTYDSYFDIEARISVLYDTPFYAFKLTEITIPDSLKKIDNLNVLADTYNYGGTIVKKVYGSKNSIAKQMADELKCEYIEIKEQPESTAAAEAN